MYFTRSAANRLHVYTGGGLHFSSAKNLYCAEALESRVLLSAGVPDTGFDTDGFRTLPIGIAENVHMVGGGKVLVVGGENTGIWLYRYNASGTPDTTFDGDGKAVYASLNMGFASMLQSDGKIVVAAYQAVGNDSFSYLVRFNSNGSIDNTFGTNGVAATGLSEGNVKQLAQLSDGKILALGYYQPTRFDKGDLAMVRYTASGVFLHGVFARSACSWFTG